MREWELNNPDIASQPLIDWDQNIPASHSSRPKHNNSMNALQIQNTIGSTNPNPTQTPLVEHTLQPNSQVLQPQQIHCEWGAPGSNSDIANFTL